MPGLQMKYFVLKPRGDDMYAKASRQAMVVYALTIYDVNPELAYDLVYWASQHAKTTKEREAIQQSLSDMETEKELDLNDPRN